MLTFRPITIDSVDSLLPFALQQHTLSCDYTPGNLVMWARFMDYRFAIHDETLFLQCKSQQDMKTQAYLPPIGNMPPDKAIKTLQEHCDADSIPLHLTAVPEPYLEQLLKILPDYKATLLDGWSDYIYDARTLATLQGKALNKKRNRYNKFMAENPQYSYSRCTIEDIAEVNRFLAANRDCQHNREDNMRCYEQWQCLATVRNLTHYNQPAGILRIDGRIVAFTLGEVLGSTLYVHIEKADHSIAGSSEAINRLFVNDMLESHPQISLVNREEDLGDPGLRQVKRAYNPVQMLHRYEVVPQGISL